MVMKTGRGVAAGREFQAAGPQTAKRLDL